MIVDSLLLLLVSEFECEVSEVYNYFYSRKWESRSTLAFLNQCHHKDKQQPTISNQNEDYEATYDIVPI